MRSCTAVVSVLSGILELVGGHLIANYQILTPEIYELAPALLSSDWMNTFFIRYFLYHITPWHDEVQCTIIFNTDTITDK